MCVFIFSTTCLIHASSQKELSGVVSSMYKGLHVKYPLFFSELKLEFSRKCCKKYSNIKFNKNPSSGIRVVPCGSTHGHR